MNKARTANDAIAGAWNKMFDDLQSARAGMRVEIETWKAHYRNAHSEVGILNDEARELRVEIERLTTRNEAMLDFIKSQGCSEADVELWVARRETTGGTE